MPYSWHGFSREAQKDLSGQILWIHWKIFLAINKRNHSPVLASSSAAQIYVAMGDNEKALQCLEQAYVRHELFMVGLKTEPGFKALQRDPRFENLCLKIGFK